MTYQYAITCLTCRELAPLVSIELLDDPGQGVAWIRLQMGCGHAPSVPERHRTAIERIAIGTTRAFVLYDPDRQPTYMIRSEHPLGEPK